MDPNLTGEAAETGIVVASRTADNHIYILADMSVEESGRTACLAAWRALYQHQADHLVYEENLGSGSSRRSSPTPTWSAATWGCSLGGPHHR